MPAQVAVPLPLFNDMFAGVKMRRHAILHRAGPIRHVQARVGTVQARDAAHAQHAVPERDSRTCHPSRVRSWQER